MNYYTSFQCCQWRCLLLPPVDEWFAIQNDKGEYLSIERTGIYKYRLKMDAKFNFQLWQFKSIPQYGHGYMTIWHPNTQRYLTLGKQSERIFFPKSALHHP